MVLIGIVSGMLVSYVSNVISGGVEVGGPVFYLDGSDNSLLLNEVPDSEEVVIWNGKIIFYSDDLNVDDFYKSKFDCYLWMKSDNEINSVKVEIRKMDDTLICESDEQVISSLKHSKEIFSCSSSDNIILGPGEGFKLIINELTGTPSEISIKTKHLYSDGYDRIEVSPI